MAYKYIDGLTVADVAFDATGRTLDELFESAGLAVTNVMVRNLKAVRPKVKKVISLSYDSVEKLLFNFLQEFIYWKDTKQLLFSMVKVKIKKDKKTGAYTLFSVLKGEKLDMERHELVVDVKAVTMHHFSVIKEKSGWKCRIVLDI